MIDDSDMHGAQFNSEAPEARKLSDATLLKLRHINLSSFLTYGPGKEAFRAFLVREFSVENLLFVEAVEQFNALPSKTKADCQALYDKFVAESSQNQVNLPGVVCQRILARIQDMEAGETFNGLFDEAYKHVMKLMQRDGYKRFQLTEEWKTHIVVFRVEDKKPASAGAAAPATANTTAEPLLPVADSAPAEIALAVLPKPETASVAVPQADV
jgi:hypothetical protein